MLRNPVRAGRQSAASEAAPIRPGSSEEMTEASVTQFEVVPGYKRRRRIVTGDLAMMRNYDIKALSERQSGSVVLAGIEERAGGVAAYRKALRDLLRGLRDETKRSVLPEFRQEIGLTRDAPGEPWFRELRRVVDRLVRQADGVMRRVLRDESERHTKRFIEEARRALGVDLNAVVRQEDLADYLEAAATRNVSLIKSLGEDTVKRIEQTVITATLNGHGIGRLKKELTEQFGIADRRAQLVARDQISKLNSDLNRARQEQAGVTTYRWRTSHDERVRALHRSLDGNEYKWGKPTGAENGQAPGQPINCRCVAQGIVTF